MDTVEDRSSKVVDQYKYIIQNSAQRDTKKCG